MRRQTQGLQKEAYWADYWAAESARRLARRLRLGHPLREAAERVLAGEHLGTSGAEAVVTALHRRKGLPEHGREWCLAVWLASSVELTDAQRSLVLPALHDAARREAASSTTLAVTQGVASGCTGGLGASMVLVILITTVSWAGPTPTWALVGSGAALVLCPFLGTILAVTLALRARRGGSRHRRIAALHSLEVHGDHRSVVPLAEAAGSADPAETAVAVRSLKRLLSTLGAEAYGHIDRGVVPALCRMLGCHDGWYWSSERWYWHAGEAGDALMTEVLEALGRFGDGRAVEHVEALSEHFPQEAVRQTAARVLSVLRERREQEGSAGRLLRPAGAPAAESLLRPAQTMPAGSPDQLLRPMPGAHPEGGDDGA